LASWYLKYVIVKDIQTKEIFYFICEKWLAVEKDDGKISRIFPIATQVQKTQLKYMIRKQAQEKLFDTHLWLSIFSRPVKSSFTRLDRTVCCFVLLYISMLANILYYGIDKSANSGGLILGNLKINLKDSYSNINLICYQGPFLLTPTQIGVGIMTNLIVFPPSLLLMQLFRKSKRRTNELKKIKKKNDEFDDITKGRDSNKTPSINNDSKTTDVKKSFALPWWCKIIAYILSFIFIGVSIFFIIVQGITFGDEKVQKWLTSFMSSVLSSILLTQPIKVILFQK
jgi:polycystin 1L2